MPPAVSVSVAVERSSDQPSARAFIRWRRNGFGPMDPLAACDGMAARDRGGGNRQGSDDALTGRAIARDGADGWSARSAPRVGRTTGTRPVGDTATTRTVHAGRPTVRTRQRASRWESADDEQRRCWRVHLRRLRGRASKSCGTPSSLVCGIGRSAHAVMPAVLSSAVVRHHGLRTNRRRAGSAARTDSARDPDERDGGAGRQYRLRRFVPSCQERGGGAARRAKLPAALRRPPAA